MRIEKYFGIILEDNINANIFALSYFNKQIIKNNHK